MIGAWTGKIRSTPTPKLTLRVSRAEEVRSLGGDKPQPVDVRVITTTSGDLEEEAAAGRFSPELLALLNVARIDIPPLRDRSRDVPLLVDHYLAHHAQSLARPIHGIADMLATGERITQRDLPVDVLVPRDRPARAPGTSPLALRPARKGLEAELIRQALRATDGNRTHAAQLLDISHRALLYKLKEYGIRD